MKLNFSDKIKALSKKNKLLLKGKWGLEIEYLRTTGDGKLALTPHSKKFGSKLKNTQITTDFSESQVELISSAKNSIEKTYKQLKKIQKKVKKIIKKEYLWPMSMPCDLPHENNIPIAKYGSSKSELASEIYRKGLSVRYGKKMQMISGIHFNYSLSKDFIYYLYELTGKKKTLANFNNDLYFSMARNFLRYRWLLIYLFGASPNNHPSYQQVIDKEITRLKKCCPCLKDEFSDYTKYATSLRVSRFGYSSYIQENLKVSYNNISDYVNDLRKILKQKSSRYKEIGLYSNGEQIQLNDNVLQKESEYYSSIRFKQHVEKGSSLLDALEKKGTKYIEIRILDLNPFEEVGISLEQLYFMQIFLLYCMFEDDNPISENENVQINKNHHIVSMLGRKENVLLYKNNKQVLLKDWAKKLLDKMEKVASLIDKGAKNKKYQNIISKQFDKINNPELLLSAKIITEMNKYNEDFIGFGLRKIKENQ